MAEDLKAIAKLEIFPKQIVCGFEEELVRAGKGMT